ncbi:MAG: DUF4382 domain-containing protein [Nitrospira sp.]|nr:DUF4382 domain-containing protein [Nitrospira sp.]
MKSIFKNLMLCSVGAMALVALGCGSEGGGGGTPVARPGTVSVSLTDAPACGYEAVVVTVKEVRIHQSSTENDQNAAGWKDITLDPPRSINLLELNDPTQTSLGLDYLGETQVTAGHYTQLRLVLEENKGNDPLMWSNYIVLESGDPNTHDPSERIKLGTPSGIQTGIKLIHQFTVGSGQRVDLLFDFDACHSIVQTGSGKYKLKPVIKVIPYELNGIEGFVDASLVGQHVIVSAQDGGEVIRAVVPNSSTDPDFRGKFFLPRLDPGSYDVVITADNHATTVITEVPVQTETSVTHISTNATPFHLADSSMQSVDGTVTLDPADDEGLVIVKAKQTLELTPPVVVTVKSLVAAVVGGGSAGDYQFNMMLPTGAPAVAPYSLIPPAIAPDSSGQSSVAKKYAFYVSAQTDTTNYATQVPLPLPAVDVTTVPQPLTFDMTP